MGPQYCPGHIGLCCACFLCLTPSQGTSSYRRSAHKPIFMTPDKAYNYANISNSNETIVPHTLTISPKPLAARTLCPVPAGRSCGNPATCALKRSVKLCVRNPRLALSIAGHRITHILLCATSRPAGPALESMTLDQPATSDEARSHCKGVQGPAKTPLCVLSQ